MKAAVAVASLVSLVGRCSGLDLPDDNDDPNHDHGHHHPSQEVCDPPPSAADEDAGTVFDPECGPPGLYRDRSFHQLSTGVVPYTPRYELWADGADKERFIYLPDDTQIDTSNPDRWLFPIGTRIYKTFSLKGVKLETRLLEKTDRPVLGYGSWDVTSYVWSKDQRTVHVADAKGEGNVLGTDHDVPSAAQCQQCHDQTGLDIVNGFEAIQLNHKGRGWTLARLIEQDRLTNTGPKADVTLENARIPGDRVDHDALGYLHANCSHCHRGEQSKLKVKFDFRVLVGQTDVSEAGAYQVAAGCKALQGWTNKPLDDSGHTPGNFYYVIDPGSAMTSAVVGRMRIRADASIPAPDGVHVSPDQMPKAGTEEVDDQGVEDISHWIARMDFECPMPPVTP